MKVLVTGGAGFIGSHLMRYLKAHGDEPVALDNLTSGRREHLEPDMELIEMDVRDEQLAGVIATGQYDAIVHLAGQTLVSYSLEEPAEDADSNILGMVRVLEAARQGGVKRVIFSSTAAASVSRQAQRMNSRPKASRQAMMSASRTRYSGRISSMPGKLAAFSLGGMAWI